MRRIITHVATSADGFISRPDGAVDWLERPEPPGGYGMAGFFDSIDTIIWGRKTYDFGIAQGQPFYEPFENFVFSRNPPETPAPGFRFVNEPVGPFAERLRARPGKDIWMMGGAEIIGSFLDAGQIDEFVLHVIPTLIGEGIPLIAPRHRTVPLKLVSTEAYEDGVVRLHYEVERAPGE